ncbi:thiosulfate oxidation carrier complex protein SoxZ [Skermanella sp. TT6]|uniref:Thiosulfate oxidation carrier complex protein SoxZ n=1 Tax=Skermanella cutis TaxID=2775420 RepID=A0ABX7B573_9PROT|nr:thiosulfate oxidation carrier complex protein SoxZ [Skermanella sp. TT6]QQP88955.1 thiosulfate oxidation carrier complex protein SoxZ [Skermanella sp. TT6]
MAIDAKPRIKLPKTAAKGELLEVKTLITHPMESGQRKDDKGQPIPRQIINGFVATFNGRQVFKADLYPSLSANPYITFLVKMEESGKFEFAWTDDDGTVYRDVKEITVG